MGKDDYNYIVFKILTYLYGCYQCKYNFDRDAFAKKIRYDVSDGYLLHILQDISDEGLIRGLCFKKVWGDEYVMLNEFEDMSITPAGIEFLTENEKMKKVKDFVLQHFDEIAGLVKLVLLP